MAAAGARLPPIERAKLISVYQNGHDKSPSKRIIVNKRQIPTFDKFLDHVTDSLCPNFGAVRNVYTPVGGSRVTDIDEVYKGGEYYVAAGKEKFHRIGYLEIRERPPKKFTKGTLEIRPVRHSRIQTSGRIRKIRTEPIIIFVHSNGNDLENPHRIRICPREQGRWEMVLDAIKDRVTLRWGGAIRRLCSLDGHPIQSVHEIENSGCYVACGSEKFVHKDYENPKVVMTSPRQERRVFQHGSKLTPINNRGSKKGSQDSSVNRTPESNSGSMNNRARKARRNQVKKEEQIIHEKPVAYKRNGKKEVNYDQDPGGVFRPRKENQATKGAREVNEDRNTRVEVPVDQREAEVVEEENIESPGRNRKTKDRRSDSTSQAIARPESRKSSADRRESVPEILTKDNPEEIENGDNPDATSAKSVSSPQPYNTEEANEGKASTPVKTPTEREDEENNSPRTPEPANEPETVPDNEQNERKQERQSKMEKKTGSTSLDEEEKAAVTIQSHYRGYRSRKERRRIKEDRSTSKDDADGDAKSEADDEAQKAAVVIQSNYRGYKTRRQLRNNQLI